MDYVKKDEHKKIIVQHIKYCSKGHKLIKMTNPYGDENEMYFAATCTKCELNIGFEEELLNCMVCKEDYCHACNL